MLSLLSSAFVEIHTIILLGISRVLRSPQNFANIVEILAIEKSGRAKNNGHFTTTLEYIAENIAQTPHSVVGLEPA